MSTITPTPSKSSAWFYGAGIQKNCYNIDDALVSYGLDWEVEIIKGIYSKSDNPVFDGIHFDDNVGVVRKDNQRPLAVMGTKYEAVQNREVLELLSETLNTNQLVLEGGGDFKGGKRVWIAARIPGDIVIANDTILKYLVVSWSHDGSNNIRVSFIPYEKNRRVSFAAYLPKINGSFEFKHTKNAKVRMTQASKIMNSALEYFDELFHILQKMNDKKCPMSRFMKFLEVLYPSPEGEDVKYNKNGYEKKSSGEKNRDDIIDIWNDMDASVRETEYGALMAINIFNDHERRTRVTKNTDWPEQMLSSSLFGTSHKSKSEAFDLFMKGDLV